MVFGSLQGQGKAKTILFAPTLKGAKWFYAVFMIRFRFPSGSGQSENQSIRIQNGFYAVFMIRFRFPSGSGQNESHSIRIQNGLSSRFRHPKIKVF